MGASLLSFPSGEPAHTAICNTNTKDTIDCMMVPPFTAASMRLRPVFELACGYARMHAACQSRGGLETFGIAGFELCQRIWVRVILTASRYPKPILEVKVPLRSRSWSVGPAVCAWAGGGAC